MPEMNPYSPTGVQDPDATTGITGATPTTTPMAATDIASAGSTAKAKVKDAASQAKAKANQLANKASEYGRTALDKVDEKRSSAANALDSTASSLRTSGEKVTNWGDIAANKIESTAHYLREHDTRRMASDFESVIRRNPGPSILIAGVLGFSLGAALRRK